MTEVVSEQYEWVPLTEEEVWRNAGAGPILDAAALGDPMALLLFRRLQAARNAMQPEVDRIKAEMEREWFGGSTDHPGGLASLLGDSATR